MEQPGASPHVLIFPFPAHGHVNSMLNLAELLALGSLKVTFLNSEHNHERLVRHTDILSRFARYTGFGFETITDGLPHDHPREGRSIKDMFESMPLITKPIFRQMLMKINPPVDCIIGDGFLELTFDVANELGIPIIPFRTVSAGFVWACSSIPDMIRAGELPIKGNEGMDTLITSVEGMETFLRIRDLPTYCRKAGDINDSDLQLLARATEKNFKANGLILNTFEELEGPILSHMRTKCPKIYTIGPLHAHLKTRLVDTKETSSNSFREVDRSCISWLDKQPKESVLYVSFGSIVLLSREQFMEFWFGLVNSGKRFLWVLRAENTLGKDEERELPSELVEGTKERGHMVSWAPQEEVLAHSAIGGFLTHSGWNSTLESMTAGVPMICWPCLVDQQLNSRFVGQVWKVGLDMKDVCDRGVVEQMVNDLMVDKRDEFVKSAAKFAKLANGSINAGGSSYCNLGRLIEDIKLMNKNC